MVNYEDLNEQQKSYVDSSNSMLVVTAIQNGWGLDKLVHHSDWFIRKQVAKQNYGNEILYKDSQRDVREQVKLNGFKELV